MPDDTDPDQPIIERFYDLCQADPRILAAVLSGSHARGAADEWSDLDVGVVVADDAYDAFAAGRDTFLRQLGEPLFTEDFDHSGIVFFVLADGTEGELTYARAGDFVEPYGPWRGLLDKAGVLAQVKPRPPASAAERRETLRRQITWFWHDLSHFITAVARGQLWWAAGQLDVLRRICLNLARLSHDFNDGEVGDDPAFKIDKQLPAAALAPLRETFVPLERAALLATARTVITFYQAAARPLAAEHGLQYPVELEGIMLGRLAKVDG